MVNFSLVNVNPKRKKTVDCVVRAISNASGVNYNQVAKELLELWLETGYEMTDKRVTDKWLTKNGFTKMAQPKRANGKKYLVGEIEDLVSSEYNVVISLANHYTCYIGEDDEIQDLWDCRYKTIGNYWVKKGSR